MASSGGYHSRRFVTVAPTKKGDLYDLAIEDGNVGSGSQRRAGPGGLSIRRSGFRRALARDGRRRGALRRMQDHHGEDACLQRQDHEDVSGVRADAMPRLQRRDRELLLNWEARTSLQSLRW